MQITITDRRIEFVSTEDCYTRNFELNKLKVIGNKPDTLTLDFEGEEVIIKDECFLTATLNGVVNINNRHYKYARVGEAVVYVAFSTLYTDIKETVRLTDLFFLAKRVKSVNGLDGDVLLDLPTSGTYTPTLTFTSGFNSLTPSKSGYVRVGNVVTIFGNLACNQSAVQPTFTMSLPINAIGANGSIVGGSGISIFLQTDPNRYFLLPMSRQSSTLTIKPLGSIAQGYLYIFSFTYLLQ